MKIAICDDLKEERESLKKNLYKMEQEENVELDITEYDSPEKLLGETGGVNEFQVIFLDIYMPGWVGTDVAMKLRDMGYAGSIIFCTTSKEHALLGFRVKADGYLVKPYTYEEFRAALWRLEGMFSEESKCVSFTSERIDYSIQVKDIIMIETEGKGCRVSCEDESYFTWKKIGEFRDEIPDKGFYQISRSCLINLDRASRLSDDSVTMSSGAVVYFPRRDKVRIKQEINDYFWEKTRSSH